MTVSKAIDVYSLHLCARDSAVGMWVSIHSSGCSIAATPSSRNVDMTPIMVTLCNRLANYLSEASFVLDLF